jgi:hypothetical protein
LIKSHFDIFSIRTGTELEGKLENVETEKPSRHYRKHAQWSRQRASHLRRFLRRS